MVIRSEGNIPSLASPHHLRPPYASSACIKPSTNSHINQHAVYRHPGHISPKSFLFRWVVAGVTGVGNEYPLYTPLPMLRACWHTVNACNNNAWIILRPYCPPIPCANNTASYVQPYMPPYMQRIMRNPHTYKRAALPLIVLALHIDSRRNTPTLHALSSVPYRPRMPTPRKDNQRATYTPQLFAPLQARRCTSFLACFPACYPACTQPTEQRLRGLPWEGSQPTRIPSANACSQ